ncbi:MAG: class A beta-lactamase-related serine hydrolase, partial [Verrucomicrobiaceae bacterium]
MFRHSSLSVVGACLVLALLPAIAPAQEAASPVAAVFHSQKLSEIDAAISLAVVERRCPGGVLWLEREGVPYHKAYGSRALEPEREPMSEDTIFDAASLTKVIATTPALMKLVEQGKVELEAPVQRYIPEFAGSGKEAITVRQLLTHTSGLRPGIGLSPAFQGIQGAIARACAERLPNPPGTIHRYSDINFILLGEVISRASGQRLEEFCANEIYKPLGMVDTGYLPAASLRARLAPTERVGGEFLRGVVHDPTARMMGGVAGHAGLFTTAADLARFSRMLLKGGELDGIRVLSPE